MYIVTAERARPIIAMISPARYPAAFTTTSAMMSSLLFVVTRQRPSDKLRERRHPSKPADRRSEIARALR